MHELKRKEYHPIIDGSPFSSAHAYNTEEGGSFLRCGISKESTESQSLLSNSKKVPIGINQTSESKLLESKLLMM